LVEQAPFRAAVRVICLDPAGRVFLQLWRDPANHRSVFWEPPGGGIEPGESEADAAVREVLEETGMRATVVPGRRVVVARDLMWNGRRHVGDEPFLLATVDPDAPLAPHALTPFEQANLLDTRWHAPADLATLPEPTEPRSLPTVVHSLVDNP
jgi:8-oxo-dGTP diphosphatase